MKNRIGPRRMLSALAIGAAIAPSAGHAIVITASQDTNTLVGALLSSGATGIVVTSVTLNGHQQDVTSGLQGVPDFTMTSSGTYTNVSGTYGIGAGVVLSTGGVTGVSSESLGNVLPGYGDGPNTADSNSWPYGGTFPPTIGEEPETGVPATSAQEALLDPITSRPDLDPPQTYDHYDVTELLVAFDMAPGFDQVSFNVVFGSEEYPEFVESEFVDGFGMFLNGVNIANVAGLPVNIRHPAMAAISGTELDGILAPNGAPVLTFSGLVQPSGNTLRFIVADTSDGIYDTTVYLSSLAGVPEIPAPPAAWLMGAALAACLPRLRRRR